MRRCQTVKLPDLDVSPPRTTGRKETFEINRLYFFSFFSHTLVREPRAYNCTYRAQ